MILSLIRPKIRDPMRMQPAPRTVDIETGRLRRLCGPPEGYLDPFSLSHRTPNRTPSPLKPPPAVSGLPLVDRSAEKIVGGFIWVLGIAP